jgi:hypothetical protein
MLRLLPPLFGLAVLLGTGVVHGLSSPCPRPCRPVGRGRRRQGAKRDLHRLDVARAFTLSLVLSVSTCRANPMT